MIVIREWMMGSGLRAVKGSLDLRHVIEYIFVISYKRTEEKAVIPDRTLLFGFLLQNGGNGCED